MAITLHGITLNPNMVWVDRYTHSSVMQDVQTTLGGAAVVYTVNRTSGQPITLVATQDQGWLTKAQVDSVQLAAQQQGLQMTLVIGSEQFTVVFRHHEEPAVNLMPLIPRAVPLDGDYFAGEIKLMTV